MTGGTANVVVIILAIGTYGLLAFLVMRFALEEPRGPEAGHAAVEEHKPMAVREDGPVPRHPGLELDPAPPGLVGPGQLAPECARPPLLVHPESRLTS
jgi:hypothetical protein